MRAAVLTELNSPLTVADVGLTPLQWGQVRVKVLASGICGAQLAEIRGDKGNTGPLPHLLGHEGCGIVEEVGAAVKSVQPGDKVVMHWRKGDGIESDFPRYIYGHKAITSGKVVTFSESAICSENRLTRVPADTPRELCALLGCGLSTALGTIENEAEMRFGENVLIIGCGGLGVSLILAAKIRGAGSVTVMDTAPKADLALGMGANSFERIGAEHELPNLLSAQIIDVVLDTAGNPETMARVLPHLASNGRYIMIGQPRPGQDVVMREANHMFVGEGKRIIATQGGRFSPTRDIPRYVQLWRSGKIKLDSLITHRISLENINQGLDLVRAGMAGRVLIEMNS